ncbi:hypothetical protein GCM10011488_46330 [Steroidobacter agaridevorans]|nr:hypothetical protein GCM10011488_46330 [Steroidobacter agaridevorans]
MPNTAIAISTQIQKIIMCRPWMSRLSSVTPTGMLISHAASAAPVGSNAAAASEPAAAYFTIFIGPNAPKCFVLPAPALEVPTLRAAHAVQRRANS